MNPQKIHNIQNAVISQAGTKSLILNDMILGPDGSQIIAQLIPQYHPDLEIFQIKGNNIDAQSLQIICSALQHCPNLKIIMAQWNFIGSSPAGIIALSKLAKRSPQLEIIDLKNNRISHFLSEYINELLMLNMPSLKVLDLRWNDVGQIGARKIMEGIAKNSHIRYVGLEDNRISMGTMAEVEQLLLNRQRGPLDRLKGYPTSSQNFFPMSQDAYPSMDAQLKGGQLRNKIQNQQKEAGLYHQKLQLQIEKVLQKINVKGKQMTEMGLKLQSLLKQNTMLINQLRESQRNLVIQKQRQYGVDKKLGTEKQLIRKQKMALNDKMRTMMDRVTDKNQRQLEELQDVMNNKYEQMQYYLKQRLSEKRINRQKLADLKEDILKLKQAKQALWDKVTQTAVTGKKSVREQEVQRLQEIIAELQSSLKSETKKGNYITSELKQLIDRSFKKQSEKQKQINQIKNNIKRLHNEMTEKNLEIQKNSLKLILNTNDQVGKEGGVEMRMRYLRYIQSQNLVNCDIQKLKQSQNLKVTRIADTNLDQRIMNIQSALRTQLAQNKLLRNQYQKLLGLVQNVSKKYIQNVLFGH